MIIILKVHDLKYIKFNCAVDNGEYLNECKLLVIIIAYRR